MNRNDLMNALSGIDPKYIDEAAFELHESPADKRKAKAFSLKKSLFVVLPAAAAILLTVTALFTLQNSKSNRASEAPAADAAAEAPAYEAEEPAAEAADEEAAYKAEEPAAEAAEEAVETADEAPAETSHSYDMKESAGDVQSLKPATNTDTLGQAERSAELFGLTEALYDNGILTLKMTKTLPDDLNGIVYSVSSKSDDGSVKICSEGLLEDIIKEKAPLTLDIADLKLQPGTYTLSVGGETIEFEVR